MKLWATILVLFLSFPAMGEDHTTPISAPDEQIGRAKPNSQNTIIDIAPPGVRQDDLEVVGTFRANVTADPNWVKETVQELQKRLGRQSPETLQAVESALNNIAQGQEPAGFAGDIARDLVKEGRTLEERLLARQPTIAPLAPAVPTIALESIPRPAKNNPTKILQKTDELSYKSPRVVRASAPPSVLSQVAFPGTGPTRSGEIVDESRPSRTKAIRGKYRQGGLSVDAVTAASPSNGGASPTTGPGVLTLAPGPDSGMDQPAGKRQIAGALFRALRDGQTTNVVSGEVRSAPAPAPKVKLGSGAMVALSKVFKGPTVANVSHAARSLALVAVRPPAMDRTQLVIYYGAVGLASVATIAYLLFVFGRVPWLSARLRRKREEEQTQASDAA